jgi:hypothetical protein
MQHFFSIIGKNINAESLVDVALSESAIGLFEDQTTYEIFEDEQGNQVLRVELHRSLDETEADELAESLNAQLKEMGLEEFDIEVSTDEALDEETYEGDDFHHAYDVMWFNEDDALDEAEYQGRKVPLGKPMRGDVKKFKVYVRKPNGNVVKVNFGDPNMRIKKSIPARRRSFRARHNCANPGPRTKARYWSCRKW